MPQSLSQLYAHLIFNTKDRFPFLKGEIRDRIHGYFATVVRDMGSQFVVVGGNDDHVHILFDIGRMYFHLYSVFGKGRVDGLQSLADFVGVDPIGSRKRVELFASVDFIDIVS